MKPYGWRMGANEIGERGRLPVAMCVVVKARARREGRVPAAAWAALAEMERRTEEDRKFLDELNRELSS